MSASHEGSAKVVRVWRNLPHLGPRGVAAQEAGAGVGCGRCASPPGLLPFLKLSYPGFLKPSHSKFAIFLHPLPSYSLYSCFLLLSLFLYPCRPEISPASFLFFTCLSQSLSSSIFFLLPPFLLLNFMVVGGDLPLLLDPLLLLIVLVVGGDLPLAPGPPLLLIVLVVGDDLPRHRMHPGPGATLTPDLPAAAPTHK